MIQFFSNRDDAWAAMRTANRAARDGAIRVLCDGPDGNFAVMPLNEAIANDFPYEWAI